MKDGFGFRLRKFSPHEWTKSASVFFNLIWLDGAARAGVAGEFNTEVQTTMFNPAEK